MHLARRCSQESLLSLQNAVPGKQIPLWRQRFVLLWCCFFSWMMVFLTGSQTQIASIDAKTLLFLILSGLATGGSWLCYYKALKDGLASVVVPVDKLSILVTIAFSYLVFHERLSKKAAAGLAAVVTGTVVMLLPNLTG